MQGNSSHLTLAANLLLAWGSITLGANYGFKIVRNCSNMLKPFTIIHIQWNIMEQWGTTWNNILALFIFGRFWKNASLLMLNTYYYIYIKLWNQSKTNTNKWCVRDHPSFANKAPQLIQEFPLLSPYQTASTSYILDECFRPSPQECQDRLSWNIRICQDPTNTQHFDTSMFGQKTQEPNCNNNEQYTTSQNIACLKITIQIFLWFSVLKQLRTKLGSISAACASSSKMEFNATRGRHSGHTKCLPLTFWWPTMKNRCRHWGKP